MLATSRGEDLGGHEARFGGEAADGGDAGAFVDDADGDHEGDDEPEPVVIEAGVERGEGIVERGEGEDGGRGRSWRASGGGGGGGVAGDSAGDLAAFIAGGFAGGSGDAEEDVEHDEEVEHAGDAAVDRAESWILG